MAEPKLPTGVRKTFDKHGEWTGYHVTVWAAGRLYSKRFDRKATLTEMKQWRDTKRVEMRGRAQLAQDHPAPESVMEDDRR